MALGEITPRVYTDTEIILYLNQEAEEMCSDLKCLESMVNIATVAGQQEYSLPLDTERVVAVSYLQGTQLKQMPCPQDMGQSGSKVQGTPARFYIRDGTYVKSGIGDNAVITVAPINDPNSRRPRKQIGFWPLPGQVTTITVTFYQLHPWITQDADEFAVPPPADRGVIAGAIAQGKLKVSDLVSYDKFRSIRNEYSEKFLRAQMANGTAEAPRFQSRPTDYDEMGGSNWIYVGPAGLV